ncbi:MAG: rimM [Gammaproteobacteria bacterium]|jgi:16S rRNA processing protein RimM|nr:rimM [Gammaproteobacteria bacterium]
MGSSIGQLPDTTEILTVGKLGRVYGLQGWMRLMSYTHPGENIFTYAPWYLGLKGQWQPCEVAAHKAHGKGWIIRLADCDHCDKANRYVNALVGIKKEALNPRGPDELYWHELIGLTVENTQAEELGTIVDLINTGANDILVIRNKDSGKEQWVPYLSDVILHIDLDEQRMQVNWDREL